jgi:ribosome-associated protein
MLGTDLDDIDFEDAHFNDIARSLYRSRDVTFVDERPRSGTLIRITDTITVDERELEERFVRASGPGGQNVNKVATAVELRFDVARSSLPSDVRERLAAHAGNRMTAEGVLLIDSREHRTQAQNREAARARLVAFLKRAAIRPRTRRPTKPRAVAREKRLASKKRRSAVKQSRGRGPRSEDQ